MQEPTLALKQNNPMVTYDEIKKFQELIKIKGKTVKELSEQLSKV